MVKNNAGVTFDDPETGEEKTVKIGGLIGGVRDQLLSKRRMQVQETTWQKMSEDEQQREIDSMTEFAQDLVEKCVGLVFSGDRRTVPVNMSKFTYKDGMCDISVSGKVNDMNELASSQRKMLVFTDIGQFDEHRDEIVAMPDSEDMFDGETIDGEVSEAPEEEAEATDETEQKTIEHDPEAEQSENEELASEKLGSIVSAENQGKASFKNGKSRDDNPYDEHNVDLMDAWFRGFQAAAEATADEENSEDTSEE